MIAAVTVPINVEAKIAVKFGKISNMIIRKRDSPEALAASTLFP